MKPGRLSFCGDYCFDLCRSDFIFIHFPAGKRYSHVWYLRSI